MIKDAQIATRGALPAVMLMALVGGGLVATERTSSRLGELARAQDIGLVAQAPIQQDDTPCERIYARTDRVTCVPIRGNQIFVATVRDHHLCVAIYDREGHAVVAPTALEIQPVRTGDKTWRMLEPGLTVAATRSERLVAIHLHDGDASSAVLKLHWLDLATLD